MWGIALQLTQLHMQYTYFHGTENHVEIKVGIYENVMTMLSFCNQIYSDRSKLQYFSHARWWFVQTPFEIAILYVNIFSGNKSED